MARGADVGTRETRLGRCTYGAYSGGGVLGTTTSNMSSRRTSSRRRVLTCQKRRVRDEEGRGGELRFGRRHDGWSCASIDGASWGEGKGKRKGREQHLLARRSGDLHHGAARNCALPRLGRRWRFTCRDGKHQLHVAATFQLGIASPAASGGEGLRSGFATHAC